MGIFDQIKNAFKTGEDEPEKPALQAKREPEPEPRTEAPPQAEPAAARTYTVQSGDTLWKIAEQELGDGARNTEIFEANRGLLDSPDHILPGQELKIP